MYVYPETLLGNWHHRSLQAHVPLRLQRLFKWLNDQFIHLSVDFQIKNRNIMREGMSDAGFDLWYLPH